MVRKGGQGGGGWRRGEEGWSRTPEHAIRRRLSETRCVFWPRSITVQTETHRQKHEWTDHHFLSARSLARSLSLDSHNGNLNSHIKTAERCCAAHVCQSSSTQNLPTSTMQRLISAKIVLSSLCRFSPSSRATEATQIGYCT